MTSPDSLVTTLSNKIRVTTESTPGHFHALGIYIDAGSRYETASTSGISHLMDRMAFKSTTDYTSSELTNLIDSLGSNTHCSSSRETVMYQSTVFPHDIDQAMRIMASTILRPVLVEEELEAQKEAAAYEIREIWAKPEMILPEILHTVAFKDNTLGMPLLCPEERLPLITTDSLRQYMSDWYRPERIVVAGVGMEHEQLVRMTEQAFGSFDTTYSLPPVSSSSSSSSTPRTDLPPHPTFSMLNDNRIESKTRQHAALARARYTGGQVYLDKPDEPLVHVYVGFEGLGIHDPDIVSTVVV